MRGNDQSNFYRMDDDAVLGGDAVAGDEAEEELAEGDIPADFSEDEDPV
jgi:hypothetical protein